MSVRKKTFLLLEVLIGIFLISLCLSPLVYGPISSYISEIRIFKEVEGERMADLSFSEIKEKLFKNEIPWKSLPEPGNTTEKLSLPEMYYQTPNGQKKKVERHFVLRCGKKGEKTDSEKTIYRKLTVEIEFQPNLSSKKQKKYSYKILAKKQAPLEP